MAFTVRDFAVWHGTLWSTVFGTVAAESDLHRAAYVRHTAAVSNHARVRAAEPILCAQAKDLIGALLQVDPAKRPNAQACLANAWVAGSCADDKNLLTGCVHACASQCHRIAARPQLCSLTGGDERTDGTAPRRAAPNRTAQRSAAQLCAAVRCAQIN